MPSTGTGADFDFVHAVYDDLAPRADAQGIFALDEPERNVVLAWWAKGEVDNGGFALLYSSPVPIDEVANAFAALGLLRAAEACKLSRTVFGPSGPPEDLNARIAFISTACDPTSGLDPWHKEDRIVWSLGTKFDSAAAEYIRQHPSSFKSKSKGP